MLSDSDRLRTALLLGMIIVPPIVQRLGSIVGSEFPVGVDLVFMNGGKTYSQLIGDLFGQKTF